MREAEKEEEYVVDGRFPKNTRRFERLRQRNYKAVLAEIKK
jgi:hypothetical protein